MTVHATQDELDQRHVNDLRWYLEYAEAEISGLHSPSMVRQAAQPDLAAIREFYSELRQGPIHLSGQPHDSGAADIGPGRCEAVRRERRVRLALAGMPISQRRDLMACFAIEIVDAREVFGRWGNVADDTAIVRELYAGARTPLRLGQWLDVQARKIRHGRAAPVVQGAHLRIQLACREVARAAASAYTRGRFLAAA